MIAWFRRRRPTPSVQPARISPEDRLIAAWWGYTPQQWAALPSHIKADKRDTVTWARAS